MAEPLNIRAVRPYRNETEFLDAEAWSVAARSILLIGAEPVPPGTPVRCELRLQGGSALIIAEGTAVKYAEATQNRPAGLVVRYKRMSSASSDFVKRAVAHAANHAGSSPVAASSPSAASLPPIPTRRTSSLPPKTTSRHSTRPPGSTGGSHPAPKPAAELRASTPPTGARHSTTPPTGARHSTKPPTGAHHSTKPPTSAHHSTKPPTGAHTTSTPAPKSRRSRPAEAEPPHSAAPAKSRRSHPPDRHSVAASSPPVPAASTHDSNAMQRLRARSSGRQITLPPDRDAVLARLKKQHGHH